MSVDFDAMTKVRLLDYAKDNSIAGVSSAKTKAEILGIIKEAIA